MSKKSVSIIIPNYNGKTLLENYLPYTLTAIENAKVDYELIVVDDASKDDSVEFIRKHYPQIILLQNESNQGFSATCNRGISIACKELTLILNSDIKLSANYFDSQWACFEQKETFGVMGRIIDQNPKVKDGPRLASIFGLKYRVHRIYKANNPQKPAITAFISGANALVCSKKLKELGGFNEIFTPFYYEDTELSIRAWRMGWKCYYDYQASCEHLGSSTINANHLRKNIKIVFYRNRYLMHALHLNELQYFLFRCQIFVQEVLPKTLIGRFWIWKSFLALSNYKEQIIKSRQKFNTQAKGSLISIFAMKKRILSLSKVQNQQD